MESDQGDCHQAIRRAGVGAESGKLAGPHPWTPNPAPKGARTAPKGRRWDSQRAPPRERPPSRGCVRGRSPSTPRPAALCPRPTLKLRAFGPDPACAAGAARRRTRRPGPAWCGPRCWSPRASSRCMWPQRNTGGRCGQADGGREERVSIDTARPTCSHSWHRLEIQRVLGSRSGGQSCRPAYA